MALVKTGDKTVAVPVVTTKAGGVKKSVKVLDEETYTEGLEKIIEKDFFPDLPNLKAQTEYIRALETNDLVKLRELQIQFTRKRPDTGFSVYSPATFETPVHDGSTQACPQETRESVEEEREDNSDTTEVNEGKKERGIHLDSYLAKNTSEDNASFSQILEESQKKHREKHAWLYENEQSRKQEEEERLALPGIEVQAAIEDGKAGVDSWKYTTKNALMYVPEGADFSPKELVELNKKTPRSIIHDNTRFSVKPWNQQKNKEMLKQAAAENAMVHSGKIGHDGKEILPVETPKVNGYGFVGTPSPAPGVSESPLMTWGEIEGTPFQLDSVSTPLTPAGGPSFKIPAIPKRDQLGFELAEKASKAHRDKKEAALKLASRLSSPSPKFGMSTTERVSSMSPAAQRLVGKSLGVRTHTDKALRASYSPSPTHSLPGTKTPTRLTPRRTPGSNRSTPSRTPNSKRAGPSTPLLTDNLLQIPRKKSKSDASSSQISKLRSRAADFF